MKTATFTKAIELASRVVERRNTIPILGALRLSPCGGGRSRLTGTDMDRQVDVEFDGDCEDMILNGAGTLAKGLRAFGGEEVTLKQDPKLGVDVDSGDLAINLMNVGVVEDFPTSLNGFISTHAAEFGLDIIKALKQVLGAVSTEATRYYLNGIYIHKVAEPWTFALVATDGHRLYKKTIEIPGFAEGTFTPCIIPHRFIELACGLIDKRIGGNPVSFSLGYRAEPNAPAPVLGVDKPGTPYVRFMFKTGNHNVTLTGKTIDGSFPDYQRVIPKEDPTPFQAIFKTQELRRALGALCADGNPKKGTVALRIELQKGTATIESHWGAHESKVRLKLPYEGDAWRDKGGGQVGVNGRYLMGALNAVNGAEEVALKLSPLSYTDPMVLEGKGLADFKIVLMPMRV